MTHIGEDLQFAYHCTTYYQQKFLIVYGIIDIFDALTVKKYHSVSTVLPLVSLFNVA